MLKKGRSVQPLASNARHVARWDILLACVFSPRGKTNNKIDRRMVGNVQFQEPTGGTYFDEIGHTQPIGKTQRNMSVHINHT